MSETLHTKYGTANITSDGYYRITTSKEGNLTKVLHRLIAADYFGDWINDPDDYFEIHHIDGDKTNNCVLNLEPLHPSDHHRLHAIGKHPSKESRKKMSEAKKGYVPWIKGRKHSEESRQKMSESRLGKKHSDDYKVHASKIKNTLGYFRVYKQNSSNCKQGFTYNYRYYDENNNRKAITCINLNGLEEKVKSKGLPWFKLTEGDAL